MLFSAFGLLPLPLQLNFLDAKEKKKGISNDKITFKNSKTSYENFKEVHKSPGRPGPCREPIRGLGKKGLNKYSILSMD